MEKKREFSLAFIFSVIFSFGFLYLMFLLPRIIHQLLSDFLPDPWPSGETLPSYYETIEGLKPIGYLAFICLLLLILIGIVAKRYKLAFLGSFSLYLPIFATFSMAMLAFAGLGLSRLLWVPLLDYYPEVLEFGNIILLPFFILAIILIPVVFIFRDIFFLFFIISLFTMVTGLLLFIISIITWFYGRFSGKIVNDFWVYRYSRHPQYLGFLLWSYGLSTYLYFNPMIGAYMPEPTLFWLISALIIIAVAIKEENGMIKKYKDDYLNWRNRTPFLLPLPKRISNVIVTPINRLLKKDWPETEKEILIVIMFYGTLLISSSILLNICM